MRNSKQFPEFLFFIPFSSWSESSSRGTNDLWKGPDTDEISNPGKAENQLLENRSILLRVGKNWLVKYCCGIHEKE